ncbi:MAG: nuclear transport factor 2 family protein [Bacteroidota bacterium]
MKKYLLLLFLFCFLFPQLHSQTLKQLLDKHAAAMGGVEAWSQMQSHIIKDESERNGKTFRSVLTVKLPNKVRIDLETKAWNRIKSYDGKEGWILRNDSLKPMPKGEDKEMAEEAEFHGELVLARSRGHQMRYEGMVELNGKQVHKIKMSKSAVDEQFYYLNPQTYLVEMISEFSEDVSWEGVEFKTSFEDYRQVEGLLFPFTTDLYANDRLLRRFKTQSIEVNAEIPDWVFEKDQNIIRRNMRLFSKALVDGDYDAVIGAYTEDGKIFPNNAPIMEGEEDLRRYWIPPANRKSKTSHHRLMPEEIRIMGNEAYDYGYYEGKTLNEDGSESSWKGKYVVIWKEVEPDVWKMYLDIWNRVRE